MCSARQENVELLAESPLHPPEMHSELSFGKILAKIFKPGYLTEFQLMWWMPESTTPNSGNNKKTVKSKIGK